ncbi:DMT family transporter [Sphingomonas sp. RS2018]
MHRPADPITPTPPPSRIAPVIAVFVANAALAFGPWFVRMADVGPVASAFWRITLAVPVLLAAAVLMGERPVRQARGLWWILAISGLTFAADLGSWNIGIRQTTLANATLFGNVAVLIYPLYGFLVARSWPTRMQGLAFAMAGAGAMLLLGRSAQLSSVHLVGDLFCVLAGVLYAVYFIAMARVRETMQPVSALAISSLLCTAPLLVGALALGETVMPQNWTPLLLMALVSQLIGQGLMIYALGHLSPLIVGIALLTQPVVAGVIGWLAYDERLGVPDFVGAALVAVALVLVRRGERAAPVAPTLAGAQRE